MTITELGLVFLYVSVLAIKTCDASPAVCSSYGFGADSKGVHAPRMHSSLSSAEARTLPSCPGVFLFFLFFGLSMLLLQLVAEVVAVVYSVRQQKKLRRLRYRGGDLVELPRISAAEFAHLPGLESSECFHLFLSREHT
jgi:hypothetical protein|eukprot:6662681-Prymnesium_polylepis.2